MPVQDGLPSVMHHPQNPVDAGGVLTRFFVVHRCGRGHLLLADVLEQPLAVLVVRGREPLLGSIGAVSSFLEVVLLKGKLGRGEDSRHGVRGDRDAIVVQVDLSERFKFVKGSYLAHTEGQVRVAGYVEKIHS